MFESPEQLLAVILFGLLPIAGLVANPILFFYYFTYCKLFNSGTRITLGVMHACVLWALARHAFLISSIGYDHSTTEVEKKHFIGLPSVLVSVVSIIILYYAFSRYGKVSTERNTILLSFFSSLPLFLYGATIYFSRVASTR